MQKILSGIKRISWLLSLVSENMLGYVSGCEHACDLWKIFEELFRSQSKARAMSLRFQLQTMKKGNLSVDEYFLQIRIIADGLRASGVNLSVIQTSPCMF